ncbi:MAG: serine/threonine protein kinase [Gemmatimonadetes bacterium]|nr:serine/threonine protein kinase [Gemmatimonadota bacterium]
MKICPVCSAEYTDDVKFCKNDGTTLRAAAPTSDLVGQVVADRYHVIKKLGEGGMGQVYLAEHVKMGRRSAIKVMNPSMVHDPDAVARFNREASNASRITHPNVCAIYDFGETPDGLIYLAMEFIEGEPLTDLLEREGALKATRAVTIFMQVADALQAAHDLGIVHRDLKPDNIMITKGRDGADMVKVVDFGIAKAVGGDDAGQKVTKTGLVVGTPEFMSPEQLSGDKLDGRSDLYSLALVFYKMLTGQLPFEAATVQETMIKRLTDEPVKLAKARPDLSFPPGIQETLDAALTRSPVDRYQAVSKFANDVAGVVGFQRGASPATPIPATKAAVEGQTQLLDTAGTKAMAAKPAPRAAAAPAKKRSPVPVIVGVVALLGAGGGAVVMLGGGGTEADSTQTQGGGGQETVGQIDTAQGSPAVPEINNVRPTGNPNVTPLAGHDSTTRTAPGTSPSGPKVDSAAIDRELGTLTDQVLEPQTLPGARRRAMELYDNPDVPTTLRGQAAFVVANAFLLEQRSDDACRWNGLALRLQPDNENYQVFKRDQRCAS